MADHWAKDEFGWRIATPPAAPDTVAAVRLAITEAEPLLDRPLLAVLRRDAAGADNGVRPVHGPFDHHYETLRLSTCPVWSYR